MKHARFVIASFLMLSVTSGALAQQATAPEPILKVGIDPPRVVVGQRAVLRVEVLAPNYMTSPPDLPAFQVRNAVTRQLQGVNSNDERNGTSYAGVIMEFAVYPQEPGSYAIPEQKLTVKYAAEPPATRETVLTVPRTSFEAFIPDAASALNPFVAASSLSAEQAVQRSSDEPKTGDAVTRTVTIKAEGLLAMLLPPQSFAAIDGFSLYPAQPSLEDHVDGRTDAMTSTRINSATYMLQRPGNYVLPAIDIAWLNVRSGEIEREPSRRGAAYRRRQSSRTGGWHRGRRECTPEFRFHSRLRLGALADRAVGAGCDYRCRLVRTAHRPHHHGRAAAAPRGLSAVRGILVPTIPLLRSPRRRAGDLFRDARLAATVRTGSA